MAFAWSWSRFKNFETCPRRYHEVDILKRFKDNTENLTHGNNVHAALANACTGKAPLPPGMEPYQHWVDAVRAGPGELLVEQRFALTRELTPCEYFGPSTWFRGVGDVVRIDGPVALVLDWKTGKINVDSKQLMLMAQCVFAYHPEVKRVRSEFVWLKKDCSTPETYDRSTILKEWLGLLPRIGRMEEAAENSDYPAQPGKLCGKWCPVSSCPNFKKFF